MRRGIYMETTDVASFGPLTASLCTALLAATTAFAHDNWVDRGAFKNGAGEWCCGDYDCKSYTRTSSTTSVG